MNTFEQHQGDQHNYQDWRDDYTDACGWSLSYAWIANLATALKRPTERVAF
jgi:hypothetical protein